MKNYLQKKIIVTFFWPVLYVLILWILFAIQHFEQLDFYTWGVLPREISGLKGIFCSIFLHGNFKHIASNTIPLLVLGGLLFNFYRRIAKQIAIWIWLISGLWLWIGGRNSDLHPIYHIGASTLIYGLATFLFFSGIFRKHLQLMVISALVVFLYGSIVWGMFPFDKEISWEGHLFGAISGVMVAFNYRKEGPQKRKRYWEEEEETIDNTDGTESNEITVNYHYTETKKEN